MRSIRERSVCVLNASKNKGEYFMKQDDKEFIILMSLRACNLGVLTSEEYNRIDKIIRKE